MTLLSHALIHCLVEHALLDYATNPNPRKFAEDAAYRICIEITQDLHTQSAHAAAFVVSAKIASFMLQRSKNVADIAILKAEEHNLAKKCEATILRRPATFEPSILHFNSIFNELNKSLSLGQDVNGAYHRTFSCEQSNTSLKVASTLYLHIYTSAYAAYMYADAMAAVSASEKNDIRNEIFKTKLTQRLAIDIGPEPITYNLFLQLICTDTFWYISLVIFITGAALLSLSICGFIFPTLAATFTQMSINAVTLTATSATMATLSTGALTGHFFTKRQWKQDNEIYHQAVYAGNVIAITT